MTCWLWCIWQDNLQYIFITHKQLSEMAFFGHKCSIQIHKIQLDFTTEDFSKPLGESDDWLTAWEGGGGGDERWLCENLCKQNSYWATHQRCPFLTNTKYLFEESLLSHNLLYTKRKKEFTQKISLHLCASLRRLCKALFTRKICVCVKLQECILWQQVIVIILTNIDVTCEWTLRVRKQRGCYDWP